MSDPTGPEPITHGAIFRKNRWPIIGTFSLLGIENLLQVAEPLVLGLAINALIAQDWGGFVLLCVLEGVILLIGVLRRLYDTRVYAKIYAQVGGDVVAREQGRGVPMTQISARAKLVQEVVDFFEFELPAAVTAIVTLTGSLAMILFLNGRVFLAALAAAITTGLIFWIASKRITGLNTQLNDELERQIAAFEKRRASARRLHFLRLARTRIQLSDLESLNFGLTYAALIAALLFGIYDGVTRQDANVGQIFALVTYLAQFIEGVIVLPLTYQQGLRTLEITKRISR